MPPTYCFDGLTCHNYKQDISGQVRKSAIHKRDMSKTVFNNKGNIK